MVHVAFGSESFSSTAGNLSFLSRTSIFILVLSQFIGWQGDLRLNVIKSYYSVAV